jgi:hypothetical protein
MGGAVSAARVAELEMLVNAANAAVDVLEQQGEQVAGLLKEVLELYERAECVGPTREERARINGIRRMLRLEPMKEWQ